MITLLLDRVLVEISATFGPFEDVLGWSTWQGYVLHKITPMPTGVLRFGPFEDVLGLSTWQGHVLQIST